MSHSGLSLAELQRSIAAAVTMPLTAGEEMQTHAPDGRPMSEVAERIVAPNSRLSAFERLEIYNRQYWFRVLGSLAEDFPALRAVLGEAGFHTLSVAYLAAHPSRSFTLRNLGSRLVEWLVGHPQFAGRRPAVAVDIARIEWAFVEAFDSAERAPLTLQQIATLDGNSRIALQPHIQLLELRYPADELVIALHDREKRSVSEAGLRPEPATEAPQPLRGLRKRNTWIAAHRLDLSVYYRRLEREEYDTLAAIGNGQPLAEALEAGFRDSRMSASRRPAAVQRWFATWAELGWLCACA